MHHNDEITNLPLNARSSRAPRAALPAPVQAEALSVPADHGLRADEEESLTPSRPKPRKPGPEHPVGGLKVDALSGALALEDEQLLAKRENLGLQLRARPQQRSNRAARRARRAGCAIEGTLTQRDENINHFNADGNSEGTGAGPPGFTGGSVNGPRRCGGKHKRWRGQRSIAFFCRRPLPPRARATVALSPATPVGKAANRLRSTQGVLTSDGANLTGCILSDVGAVSADGLTIRWTA
jgi:hypothetical protein